MGTLTELRNSILTSVHGRRLGFNARDFLVGPKGFANAIQSLTSGSTANIEAIEITNYGVTALDATTGAASTQSSIGTTEGGCKWSMAAPEPGAEKIIYKISATGGSTMPVVALFGTGVTGIWTTMGTTFTGVRIEGVGGYVRLLGKNSTSWIVIGMSTGTSLASSN